MTKFLAGHSDVILGAVAGGGERVERIRKRAARLGSIAAPMDSWLAMRGVETFVVRMRRASETARNPRGLVR